MKGVESCPGRAATLPGRGAVRRPACSGSQDNPGLFQEESPKKKKRSVASRWADNPAYLRDWRERALWGPCPLRREGAKCMRGRTGGGKRTSGRGPSWGGGTSRPGPVSPRAADRSPSGSDGRWRPGFPEVTPKSGAPDLIQGLNARQQPQRRQAFYVLLFQVVQGSGAHLHLLEAQCPRGVSCGCV